MHGTPAIGAQQQAMFSTANRVVLQCTKHTTRRWHVDMLNS